MADAPSNPHAVSTRVKVWGTLFLVFQMLFAINNYGPHRIPGLHLLFDAPWIAHTAHHDTSTTATSGFTLHDATENAGLDAFRRAPFHQQDPHYLEVMGGGVAVGDYDGDGNDDVFLTSLPSFADATTQASPSTLFRNQGDGTFADVTAQTGLAGLEGYPQGALFFDFDNDGDQDLYVAAYRGGQLFRNDDGRFVDITKAAGVDLEGKCGARACFASSATAADYNRDGHLDLLVVNNVAWNLDDPDQHGKRKLFPAFFDPQPLLFFRNEGDGTFTEVSGPAGLRSREGKGLSAVWLDANRDRWPDLYVANDLTHNALYVNDGDGTFTDVAAGAGVDEIKSSMGVAAGDVDRDGYTDLVTTNLQGSKVSLFRSDGTLRFTYATDHAGLGGSRRASGWGVQFADLDLDGALDLVTSGGPLWTPEDEERQNLIFRNRGNGQFDDVTATSGRFRNDQTSRGLAVLDADGSGSPDLLFANADSASPQLLLSRPPADHRWLSIHLEGTRSNRDGVGARVTIERADGQTLTRTIRAGGSYQSTSTKTLLVGLGTSTASRVTVDWPSGATDVVSDPPVNDALTIVEGDGAAPGAAPSETEPVALQDAQ